MARRKDEAKVTFTADTAQFNDAIKAANSTMTKLRSELKLNAAQMKNSGASVESLTESKRILEDQDAALASKVEALNGKLLKAEETWGANSAEAQRYATQLNNARAQQERVRAAIDQASAAIEEQTRAEQEAQGAHARLSSEIDEQRQKVARLERAYADAALEFGEGSAECAELRGELSRAGSDLREAEARMKGAEDAARGLARGLDDVEGSAGDAGVSLGELAGADFVSDMAQELIGTLAELSEETLEYSAAMGRLDNAYEFSGRSAETAREVYQNFLGLVGDSDQAVEAAQDMNNLADAGADIDAWYSIAAGTVSAFGDALPVENLIESANETIRTGKVTGGLADALNWTSINAQVLNNHLGTDHPAAMAAFNRAVGEGLSNEDALNAALEACSTEQERQEVLTAVLFQQYTELGDSYLATSGDIDEARRASDDLMNAQADLAEKLRPLQTLATELAANGIQFLSDHMTEITSVVVGLAAGFIVLKGSMIMETAVGKLSSALSMVKMGLAGVSPPVMLVAGAIAALVAGFIWAYNEVEPFRTAIDGVVAQFRDSLGPILQQVGGFLSTVMQQALTGLADIITTYVVPAVSAFGEFLTTTVFPALQQFSEWFSLNIIPVLQQLWGFLTENILPLLGQFADFVLTTVVPALGELWGWFAENIVPILQDLWGFFTENILPVLAQFAGFVTGTVVPAIGDMWGWFSSNILPVLRDVWSFISANILPIFGQFAGFVTGTVVPALGDLWNWFSANILPAIKSVGDKVEWCMDRFGDLARFIGGLKIEFPHFRLPHLKYSGEFSLIPPKVPKFWIEWYAKGAVLNKPTIFGMNGGNPMAGGEAGPEAVSPISVLQDYVSAAVSEANGGMADAICAAIDRLAERDIVLEVAGRQIATAIAGDTDRVNGARQNLANRGLAV